MLQRVKTNCISVPPAGLPFIVIKLSPKRNVCCLRLERHAFKLLLKRSEFFLLCVVAVFQEIIYGTTTDRQGFHY